LALKTHLLALIWANGTKYNRGRLRDANHALSTLATFNGAHGQTPFARLLADASGKLYGTTNSGGASGDGIAFEVANNTNHTLTTLFSFNGTNGAGPESGRIADANGNLYGTTSGGGANGDGTVFELSPEPEPSTEILFLLGPPRKCRGRDSLSTPRVTGEFRRRAIKATASCDSRKTTGLDTCYLVRQVLFT
jgi:uncharacterized repeat protein (TIGR03803 family)